MLILSIYKITKFSDDGDLGLNVVEAQLQSDLDAVAQWISSSRLCSNVVNSSAMLIGSQPKISGRTLDVSIRGTVLNLSSVSWCYYGFVIIMVT